VRQAYDVSSPRQAHQAVTDLYQGVIKPHTATGARGRIIFETVNPTLRQALRKMFHGPILTDFSEQVWLTDPETNHRIRYAPAAWKEVLKDMFCPPKEEPRDKKLVKSTELLSDDEFSEFLTAVQAFGVVDMGIEFTEKDD
jgi:hypothetical protein